MFNESNHRYNTHFQLYHKDAHKTIYYNNYNIIRYYIFLTYIYSLFLSQLTRKTKRLIKNWKRFTSEQLIENIIHTFHFLIKHFAIYHRYSSFESTIRMNMYRTTHNAQRTVSRGWNFGQLNCSKFTERTIDTNHLLCTRFY